MTSDDKETLTDEAVANENSTADQTATAEEQQEEKELTEAEQVIELETQLKEAKDKHLRLFAEFENFKKRNMRERMELIGTASKDTMAALLPILDDFDRAKKSADDEASSEQMTEGVVNLYNRIYTILGSKGLKAMESDGLAFDPELHEAITEIPAPSEDMKGKIIDTIEKGYYLNDKIIRFAKVVVGK